MIHETVRNFSLFCLFISFLMPGCALFQSKANVTATAAVASPVVVVDGKVITKTEEILRGDYTLTSGTQKIGGVKVPVIEATKFNLWSFLGGFGVWFLLGGGFMLVALISLIWVKNYGVAWSAFLTGSAILAGAFTLKLFWVHLAWITLVGALLILIFALLHNKKLIVNVVKDIADDGKVNHSAK